MSDFSDSYTQCMTSAGLPVPDVETLNDAKELIEQLHSAWENAGGDEEMLIGGLVALGAVTGIDEATLAVLGEAAAITVTAYLAACLSCLASAGVDQLRQLFASNPDPWMQQELASRGVDVGGDGTQVATA